MQNKPNFLNTLMNISFCLTKRYEQKPPLRQSENKAKTNPISEKQKMKLNFYLTKEYANKPLFRPPTKQSQSNQISAPAFSPLPLVDRSGRSKEYMFLTSKGLNEEKLIVKPLSLGKRTNNGFGRNKGIDSYTPYMLKYVN